MSWYFKFSCDCKFPKEKCTRKWIQNHWYYVCPKHPETGKMIYRLSICESCLKEFKVNPVGQIPKKCYNCKQAKLKELHNKVTIIPLNHPDIIANEERSDCKYRIDHCLKKYRNNEKILFLPCKDCENYQKEEIKPISFAYKGGDWLDD